MSQVPLTPREKRLTTEVRRLRALLEEPVRTVEAIRRGEVDAFVVSTTEEDDHIYVLKSADRLYRLMVEAMGEGAVALSNDGAITYCNPHFVGLLERSRDELLGHPLRNFISEETRDVFDTLLKTSARGEIELLSPYGTIPVAVASTLISDPDGSHFCLVINDLRDQKTRDQLRAAKEAAELANRTKDDFLAMVSHELRSPITVILGWTRMLQMNRVDRDTVTLGVDNIHNSTARLLKLVEDILDASRLSSGKINFQPEVLDLRDTVRTSLDSVRIDVDQKPLRVTVQLPDDPVLVKADAGRLQQVVVNLLANAIKFTPPHGSIDVVCRTDTPVCPGTDKSVCATLSVTDSGEGIDSAFLPHVFERFRQDDGSTTRAHKGLGLGLAIVKQLVDAHDGKVSAHSKGKGLGATFTVSLPVTAEAVPRAAVETKREPLPRLDSTRILLVDDEPETVEVMRTILHSAGAIVDAATTVAHALELAASFDPHVIATDIAMPGQDGFEFLRALASPHIPVLAITGKSTPTDRDEIVVAGFSACLVKPIEPEELIRTIAGLIAAR